MTQPLEELLAQIREGRLPPMTPARRRLAEVAVKAQEERKDENIEEWARRLAASVASADD